MDVLDDVVFILTCAFDQLENRTRIGCAEKRDILFQRQTHDQIVFGFEVFDLGELVGHGVSVLYPTRAALVNQTRSRTEWNAAGCFSFDGWADDAKQLAVKEI